jgi:pSer/pThr/pTyr-binding forkhead associated (FHA) protein
MLEESRKEKSALEDLRQVEWDESRATIRLDQKNFAEILEAEREKDERQKAEDHFASASSEVDALLEQEGVAMDADLPKLSRQVTRDTSMDNMKDSDLGQTLLVTPPTATEAIRDSATGEGAGAGFSIVLKLTTFSADEVTAFELKGSSATIGRGPHNTVSIPEDVTMDEERHAEVFFKDDKFFLQHGKGANGTFVRLKPSSSRCTVHGEQAFRLRLEWPLVLHTVFKVGTTEFKVVSIEESDGVATSLQVVGMEGKLKDREYTLKAPGVSIGRSNDNGISTGDGEVSRRHAQISFCEHAKQFMIRDLSSTNGTYIRLCGPNEGPSPPLHAIYCIRHYVHINHTQTHTHTHTHIYIYIYI